MISKNLKIQVFGHPQFGEIRVTGTSDEPLFCLVDICKVLELNNTSMAKRKLKATGIKIFEVRSELTNKHGKTIAFMDNLTFISEQNLYRLIMRSTKPMAEPFQDWVCGEVLPSIRRNGAYLTDDALARFAEDPDYGIKLLNTLKRERTERLALMKENVTLSLENERMKPMADYCAKILACPDTVTVTQIAQDYGMTAQDFNEMLADMKIQYRCGRQWILYSGYKQQGFVQSATTTYTRYDGTKGVRVSSRWTQLGRIFLYERLKGEGVMPIKD